jgi:hypothetical protein
MVHPRSLALDAPLGVRLLIVPACTARAGPLAELARARAASGAVRIAVETGAMPT